MLLSSQHDVSTMGILRLALGRGSDPSRAAMSDLPSCRCSQPFATRFPWFPSAIRSCAECCATVRSLHCYQISDTLRGHTLQASLDTRGSSVEVAWRRANLSNSGYSRLMPGEFRALLATLHDASSQQDTHRYTILHQHTEARWLPGAGYLQLCSTSKAS
jgi:hypothetical protein